MFINKASVSKALNTVLGTHLSLIIIKQLSFSRIYGFLDDSFIITFSFLLIFWKMVYLIKT